MAGRPFSKQQSEFLRLWSATGRGRASITDFCNKHDIARTTIFQWRSRNSRFRLAMDQAPMPAPKSTSELDQFVELAAERWPHLPAWQGLYLEVWRETVDRDTACRHVGKEWREIRDTRKKVKRFEAACREIEEVFQVRVEDAEERSAIAGKAASAGRYLEAKRSRLAKSAGKKGKPGDEKNTEDPKLTAQRYAEIFKAHSSRGSGTDVAN